MNSGSGIGNLLIVLLSQLNQHEARIVFHQPVGPTPIFTTERFLAVPGNIVHHFNEPPPPVQWYMYRENESRRGNENIQERSIIQQQPNNFPNYLNSQEQLVHRHISIHVPPEEMEFTDQQVNVVRPNTPEKHVNIIFIKAPTAPQQEIVLPEPPQHKTLVYVLVKRQENGGKGSLRVHAPPPTKPSKPDVYYIRYKEQKQGSKISDSFLYNRKKQLLYDN